MGTTRSERKMEIQNHWSLEVLLLLESYSDTNAYGAAAATVADLVTVVVVAVVVVAGIVDSAAAVDAA